MSGRQVGAVVAILVTAFVSLVVPATAERFGGVEFPQGKASFADLPVAFQRGTEGDNGGPARAIGPPQGDLDKAATLGNGGTLTIRFTNNVLTGSGDAAPDLYIFETGNIQELVTVEVSQDGTTFVPVGQTFGQTGEIDLDAFGFGPVARFFFVRVTDIVPDQPADGDFAGADIDAIGAITTIALEPPIARNDTYRTDEDTPLVVPAPGIFVNDEDPDGTFTLDRHTQPDHGTVTVDPTTGAFSYTPEAGFTGVDTFQYTIVDNDGAVDSATVTITIDPVNDAPTANDDAYTTDEDTRLDVGPNNGLLPNDDDPDGDRLRVIDFSQPANGTVEVDPDGRLTYRPNPDFTGIDTFEYTIADEEGLTDTATVTITIEPVNDPPVARNNLYTTQENTTLTVDPGQGLLPNDEDPEGGNLTVQSNTAPNHGTVTVNPDGSMEYTPDQGFAGVDTFEYTIVDEDGETDTARVIIIVGPAPLPDAVNDRYRTQEGTLLRRGAAQGLFPNDDPAVGDFTTVGVTRPRHGHAVVGPDGALVYRPDKGFCGLDRFEYTAENANGDPATAVVTILVTGCDRGGGGGGEGGGGEGGGGGGGGCDCGCDRDGAGDRARSQDRDGRCRDDRRQDRTGGEGEANTTPRSSPGR